MVCGGEGFPETCGDEHDEGSEEQGEHCDGAFANDYCSAKVPEGAEQDDGEGLWWRSSRDEPAVQSGSDAAEMKGDEDRRDKWPYRRCWRPERARPPGIPRSRRVRGGPSRWGPPSSSIASGGEFADHVGEGEEAPDERHDEQ